VFVCNGSLNTIIVFVSKRISVIISSTVFSPKKENVDEVFEKTSNMKWNMVYRHTLCSLITVLNTSLSFEIKALTTSYLYIIFFY